MEGEKIGRSWWTCVKRTREKELSSFPLSISSSYPIVGFERSLSSHCYSSLRSSLLLSLLLFSSVIITWGVCTPQGLHNEMKSSSEPPESGNEPFLSHFFFDRLHSFSSSSFFSSGEGDDERYYPLSFSLTWISISALSWFIISQLPVHRVPLCLLPSSIRRNIYRQIGQAAKDIRLASVAKREKRRRLEKASLTDGSTQRRDKERREDFEREEKEDEEEKEKELERRARTAQAFLVSVRNRSIGFIHAVAISCFALACVTLDRNLTQDRMDGNSPLFTVMGVTLTGYFVWDFFVILYHWTSLESLQWLLHCVISILAVSNPFTIARDEPPMTFYAASLALFELSTPFLALRYFYLKGKGSEREEEEGRETSQDVVGEEEKKEKDGRIEREEEIKKKKKDRKSQGRMGNTLFYFHMISVAFGLTFFCVRIAWGLGWLFPSMWREIASNPRSANFLVYRKIFFFTAMPVFALLNLFWFCMILKMLVCPSASPSKRKDAQNAGGDRDRQTVEAKDETKKEEVIQRKRNKKDGEEEKEDEEKRKTNEKTDEKLRRRERRRKEDEEEEEGGGEVI